MCVVGAGGSRFASHRSLVERGVYFSEKEKGRRCSRHLNRRCDLVWNFYLDRANFKNSRTSRGFKQHHVHLYS